MEYRNLGDSDLRASVIGFGTWELGGGYGVIAQEQVVAAMHRALDLGVTLFDTAPAYGNGRSERILGQALGARRKDAVLVTKCGIRWDEEGRYILDGRRASILEEVDESLARLQTDYIDLLLVHRPDLQAPRLEVIGALQEVRQSGKARYVGVSNYSSVQLQEVLSLGPLIANQVGYNLFDRRMEETVALCQARGIGVMAYGSLCYGLLTGTFSRDTVFGNNDWRQGDTFGQALFEGQNFAQNLEVVEKLKEAARSLDKSLPQLAINWVLSDSGVTAALTGCRRPKEIEDNVKAVGWSLSDADKLRIERIMKGAAGLSDVPWPNPESEL